MGATARRQERLRSGRYGRSPAADGRLCAGHHGVSLNAALGSVCKGVRWAFKKATTTSLMYNFRVCVCYGPTGRGTRTGH
eukprot:656878-Prymnesium_polylepis.1